jgi:hypothetical protein
VDRHRLGKFALTRNPHSGDLLLLADVPVVYKAVLGRAFPDLFFSRTFEDRHGQYAWGTYVKRAGDAAVQELTDFCELLRECWLLEDDLTEMMALSLHTETSAMEGFQRTSIGQLVFDAKAYDRWRHPGNPAKADELAELMARVVQRHPAYRRSELIVPVLGSNSDKPFDLPQAVCRSLSRRLNIPMAIDVLSKVRDTKPMKDVRTIPEKVNNVEGVFRADEQLVNGKRVLLVDDIYQTGFSINEVGRALRVAGALSVVGLVATKTMQDL